MNSAWTTEILRQETGGFSRRYAIGPAKWSHFDLLWNHEGHIRLDIGENYEPLELEAPNGVLIFPGVSFRGKTRGPKAEASICHFMTNRFADSDGSTKFLIPPKHMSMHVQSLLRLSLYYAKNKATEDMRVRLLHSILDAMECEKQTAFAMSRVQSAWSAAEDRLGGIRSLTDVADHIGLSESSFRALHRKTFDSSAGQYLREMRLRQGERLLATSGESVSEISKKVGYSSPESFSYAFKAKFGQSPLEFRKWARNFA